MLTPCMRKAMRNQLDNPALPIVMYLGIVGVLSVLSGGAAPGPVEHATPMWLTHAWSWSLALGGVVGTVACLTGRTRGESAGLTLLLFGLGLYGLAAAVTHWPVGLVPASGVLALMAVCTIRLRVLHLARKAQRKAQRIVSDFTERGVPPWIS